MCPQMDNTSRRRILKAAGAGGVIGLSGCLASNNGSDGDGGSGGGDGGSGGGDGGSGGGGSNFPSEPIRFIVPFGEGGATDVFARSLAPAMGEHLGGETFVENLPGGAGLRGVGEGYHSDPDGHTVIACGSTPFAWLVQEPDWDLLELEAIGQYTITTWVLVANQDWADEHGIKEGDIDACFDVYRNGDESLIAGQDQEGGISHLMALIMRDNDEYNVPWESWAGYDGSSPLLSAVTGGEVPLGISADKEIVAMQDELVRVGNLYGPRSPVHEDLPSVTDAGYPNIDFVTSVPLSYFAPPDTPDDIIQQLTKALEVALEHDDVVEMTESQDPAWPRIYTGPEETYEKHFQRVVEELPQHVDLDQFR